MEYTLLILLLLIMIWINLRNKISKSQEKTEELLKEIAALRRRRISGHAKFKRNRSTHALDWSDSNSFPVCT